MDKRIVVAFDIHETILIGLVGYLKRLFNNRGKAGFIDQLSHYACSFSIPVFFYSLLMSKKNKEVYNKMLELYKQKDIFKVVLLTDCYKSCRWALQYSLKVKGIECFDDIICRDYIYESTITHKVKKIKKYNISFIYDDNHDMVHVMDKTDCRVIGMID